MDKSQGKCNLHNIRFYNLAPRSINRLAYDKSQEKLALSRNDATIEIWNMTAAPFVEKTIFCSTADNDSVEDLKWAGSRLFSVGFNDCIKEWNLKLCKMKQKSTLIGTNAWCLDTHVAKSSIAVGTEEGYINILSILDNDLAYEKVLDKQEGRIVSCCFDKTGQYLVSGSLDAIRIWNIQSGHAIHKIGMGRSEKNKETIVWSLAVLSDFTIISGDSRGRLTFFDGNLGTQTESFQLSPADLLCIAVDDNEEKLYCSGIESTLRMFSNANVVKDGFTRKKWVRDVYQNIHRHDVRSIVSLGTKSISGGVDGYLTVSYPPRQVHRYGPFLQAPCTIIATKARLVLLKYINYLEIWRLGSATDKKIDFVDFDEPNAKRQALELAKQPEKLLELRSKNDENVVCAALSLDGRWLSYSNNSTIRLFRFKTEDSSKPTMEAVKDVPKKYFTPCRNMIFSSDCKFLYLVHANNRIDLFELGKDDSVNYLLSITDDSVFQNNIHLITVSACGRYVACAATCNNVAIWEMSPKGAKLVKKFPRHSCPATAIAFRPDEPILIAAYSDHEILQYTVTGMSLKKLQLSNSLLSDAQPISNIVFDTKKPDVLVVHNDSMLCSLLPQGVGGGVEMTSAKKKKKSEEQVQQNNGLTAKLVKKYKHLVHIGWLGDSEMVAVEVNPVTFIEQLPPGLKQKKYGVS